MPYTSDKPLQPPSAEELRARIPGWGADLDPADRPAVPREQFDPAASGAHWELPEQQPGAAGRERSIEHARVTPTFGTSVPLKGLSGRIRRLAYRRFSEGRAAHWLLLLLGDRIDVVESLPASLPPLSGSDGLRTIARAHGLFNVVTGAWPVLHIESFEAVTGPKADRWLVRTVGGLLVATGVTQVRSADSPDAQRLARLLGLGVAGTLAAIDVVYAGKGRIRRIYLADAAMQLGWVAAWALSRESRPSA